jgi:hypothetical protein
MAAASSTPTYCIASSAVIAGAVLATTQLHDTSVPKSCIASSLLGPCQHTRQPRTHARNVLQALSPPTHAPTQSIRSTLAGSTALTVALVHHGNSSTSPPWYCMLGGLGGIAAIGYALTSHVELSAIPTKCKIATATGIALVVVGTVIAARK